MHRLPLPVDPSLGNAAVRLCAETYPPYVGVTSTPVVDTATDTLFVKSFDPSGRGAQVLYALSLKDQFRRRDTLSSSRPWTGPTSMGAA